jgi:hypothetical protein
MLKGLQFASKPGQGWRNPPLTWHSWQYRREYQGLGTLAGGEGIAVEKGPASRSPGADPALALPRADADLFLENASVGCNSRDGKDRNVFFINQWQLWINNLELHI